MLLSYAALNTTLSTFTSGRIATSPATFPLRKVRNSRSTFARCFGRRNNLVLKRHCIDPSDLQRLVLQGGLLSTRSDQNAPCFHIDQFPATIYTVVQKKNAPTLADYNYNPVQSILIIFSKLFTNIKVVWC